MAAAVPTVVAACWLLLFRGSAPAGGDAPEGGAAWPAVSDAPILVAEEPGELEGFPYDVEIRAPSTAADAGPEPIVTGVVGVLWSGRRHEPVRDGVVEVVDRRDRRIARAITDEEGRFRIAVRECGEFRLSASSKDGSDAAWQSIRIRSGDLLDLGKVLLLPTGSVVGTVRSASGGAIAGAQVRLADQQARSAADGSFRIDGAPWGKHEISVTAEGFVDERRGAWVAGGRLVLDLEMEPFSPLDGIVTDVHGRPLPGAKIIAEGGRLWTADDAGRFRILSARTSPVGLGWISATVSHPDVGSEHQFIPVDEPVVVLGPGIELEVEIQQPFDAPAEVSVQRLVFHSGGEQRFQDDDRLQPARFVAPDRFVLRWLEREQRYRVRVRDARGRVGVLPVDVPEERASLSAELRLGESCVIRGKLRDGSGSVIDDAELALVQARESDTEQRLPWFGRVDALGRFDAGARPRLPHSLQVRRAGVLVLAEEFEPPETGDLDLDLEIPLPARVSGRVLTDDPSRFELVLSIDEPRSERISPVQADGTFAFAVPPGWSSLSVRVLGPPPPREARVLLPSLSRVFHLEPGAEESVEFDVRDFAFGAVHLRVLRSDGRPCPHEAIALEGETGRLFARTDAEGLAVFASLPAGAYEVTAGRAAGSSDEACAHGSGLVVRAGEVTRHDHVLRIGGLRAFVRDEDGRRVTDVCVELRCSSSTRFDFPAMPIEGEFAEFPDLPPGGYVVRATSDGNAGPEEVVTITAGQESTVELRAPLR